MLTKKETKGPEASVPSGAGKPDPHDADEAVGPLLARANLLRMRGQWDEAITVTADALRRAPQSPTAHSLMGDIYDAQGKYADAIPWYAMALDLAPGSRSDREKWERLTKAAPQQSAETVAGREQTAVPRRRAKPAPASERTLEWFDRIFPPGKGESIARLIFAVSGVATVLILGAAAFLYFTFVSDDARETAAQAAKTGLAVPVPARQPTTAQPTPPVPPASPVPSASALAVPSGAPGALNNAPVSGGASDDAVLLAALKAALAPGVNVTAARFDPRVSQVSLDAVIAAPGSGDTTVATRERVVRAATLIAKAAQAADKRVVRATVRIALGDDNVANSVPVLSFVGDTTSVQARDADPVVAPYGDLLARFANPWWATGLAPGA